MDPILQALVRRCNVNGFLGSWADEPPERESDVAKKVRRASPKELAMLKELLDARDKS